MVAFCPDYRVGSRQKTSALACIIDAKSAMRYIVSHSNDFGIDNNLIVAAGSSAGGHLAACLATLDGFNENGEDTSIPTKPYALILTSPALQIENLAEGHLKRFEGHAANASPVNYISKGMPPTLILIGKREKELLEDVQLFKKRMEQNENNCTIITYEDQTHGFSSYKRSPIYFEKTLTETELFLKNLHLLKGSNWIKKFITQIPTK